jgi:hypothetical protein
VSAKLYTDFIKPNLLWQGPIISSRNYFTPFKPKYSNQLTNSS